MVFKKHRGYCSLRVWPTEHPARHLDHVSLLYFVLNRTVAIKALTEVISTSACKHGFLVLPVGEALGASHFVNSTTD